jgi:hypothetical protein
VGPGLSVADTEAVIGILIALNEEIIQDVKQSKIYQEGDEYRPEICSASFNYVIGMCKERGMTVSRLALESTLTCLSRKKGNFPCFEFSEDLCLFFKNAEGGGGRKKMRM